MTLEEALISALDYEHRVRDHYARAAEHTLDPVANRIFARLAIEEQQHVDYLMAQLKLWRAEGKIEFIKLTTILPDQQWIEEGWKKLKGVNLKNADSTDELDAFERAWELENEVAEHYQRLVDELDAEGQEMFARFLKMELLHKSFVEIQIQALKTQGKMIDLVVM